jgi:hypothetical protein
MSQEIAGTRKSNGLSILWDMVVAPRAAFAALREQPQWLWAFLITSVLGAIGSVLLIPAYEHVATAMFAAQAASDPNVAAMPPEQQKRMLNITIGVYHWLWLAYPLIVLFASLFTAVLLLIFNAIGGGDGNFKRFWALAVNVAFINFGIGYLLIGVLGYFRGPDTFATQRDVTASLPNLSWLVPGAGVKLGTFLGAFNPFSVWSLILLALGMEEAAHVKRAVAWGGAIALLLIGAILGGLTAK